MGKTYRRNSNYRPGKGRDRDNLNEITRLKKKDKKKGKRPDSQPDDLSSFLVPDDI